MNVKRANWSKKLGDTGLRLGGAIIKGSLQKKYVTHFGGWGCLGQNQCHLFFAFSKASLSQANTKVNFEEDKLSFTLVPSSSSFFVHASLFMVKTKYKA